MSNIKNRGIEYCNIYKLKKPLEKYCIEFSHVVITVSSENLYSRFLPTVQVFGYNFPKRIITTPLLTIEKSLLDTYLCKYEYPDEIRARTEHYIRLSKIKVNINTNTNKGL